MKMRKCIKGLVYGILIVCILTGGLFLSYRRPFRDLVETYSNQYGLDSNLVYAVMKAESGYDPMAISKSGAKGLMQIMNKTGTWGAEECAISDYANDRLFEPSINIQIGTWYLARLMKQYEGNLQLVLAAYNAGTGNVAKWRNNTLYSSDGNVLHTIPFKETQKYIQKVSFYYKVYNLLY